MNIDKTAEDIARDSRCAGGQFNERLETITAYLQDLDKMATIAGWVSYGLGVISGAALCYVLIKLHWIST